MLADGISPSARITAAFATLADSAQNINAVSDELSRPVASLERALKGLNLGVACWTVFAEWGDGYDFLRQYVGYAQVNGDWCIAIQTSQGQESHPEESNDDIWKFNESPLHLRVKAIDKLPDLVEALVKTADATADRLKKKVEPAQELADAVNTFLQSQKKK